MNRSYRCAAFITVASLLLVSLTAAQIPTTPSRITRAIDNTSRVTLSGTTPKAMKTAHDLDALDGSHPLQRMLLVLKPSVEQKAALQQLIESQQRKGSPAYHKWLKPEEFAARFGPAEDDLAKIKGWLQQQGLSVTSTSKGRQWIEFSGSAQQVNDAFQTSIHEFDVNGEKHIANVSDISIPQALAPVVGGVLSLHNFRKQPMHTKPFRIKRNDKGKLVPVTPDWTYSNDNGVYYYVAPADFQTIYNLSPLLNGGIDGTGIAISIAGRSDIYLTDVQVFRQGFSLPENDPNIIVNGPDPGLSWDDAGESSLDVEWAGAAAPGATINLVESGSTDTTDGVDLSNAYIVDNALSPIMSLSYGLCEMLMGPTSNQFYEALWAQAAAEGITVFVSTGDQGAGLCDGYLQDIGAEPSGPAQYGPTINGLSSTPYNVAVGGTQYVDSANYSQFWSPFNSSTMESALGYIPEQSWNESCDPTLPQTGTNCVYGQTSYNFEGAGGGPSNCSQSSVDSQGNVTCIAGYAKPSWQTGTGVPNDGVRDTPDVALNASPDDEGYVMCFGGACETTTLNGQTVLEQANVVGGTSVSSPAMAGIMALIEQKNGAFQGQADYVFYHLASADNLTACNSSNMTSPGSASVCNFNDITMGSNSVPGLPGYGTASAEWSAGTGYDMTSGLGTVNAANLVANWSNVTFLNSSTALTTNGTTVKHGQPLTIGVSVAAGTGASGTPTGNFALKTDKYGAVGELALSSNGNFSGPVTTLPGGSYNLTAEYGGDGTFGSSTSSPVALTVSPENSSTSLQLYSVNNQGQLVPLSGSSTYGAYVYFKIQVSGSSGNGSPTGTVSILNGTTVLTTVPLNQSGSAMVESGDDQSFSPPVGNDSLSVQYSGDNSFAASTSPATSVTFGQAPTYVYTVVSATSVPAGQPVLLSANLWYGGTALPTGTFQFYDNGSPLSGQLPIAENGGLGVGFAQATYKATLSTPGSHVITTAYSGDTNYQPVGANSQNTESQTITVSATSGAASTVSIVQTPSSVTYGQSFNYIVAVKPVASGGPTPTGQIWVYSNNFIIDSFATLTNGQAILPEQVGAGTFQVYAQYPGDSNYAASTSPIVTTTVARQTPVVTLTTPAANVLAGSQTSLDFVAVGYSYSQNSAYSPGGTVQFFTSVNGGAAQAVAGPFNLVSLTPPDSGYSIRATLPVGTNVVTAQYSGDQYFKPTTSAPVTILVSSPDFTVAANSSSIAVSAGGSATASLAVEPVLGFAQPVSLSCASGLPSETSCSFSPATIPAGGGQSTLTVTMQGPFTTQSRVLDRHTSWWTVGGGTGLFGLFLLGSCGRRRKLVAYSLITILVCAFFVGCGSGNSRAVPTTVVLSTSNAKVASGTQVTLTAEIVGNQTPATGSVTFYDGTTALGNASTVTNGLASMQVSNLAVGTHAITAKYSGDARHDGSTSSVVYQAITGSTTLQVVATAGSLSHTVSIDLTVQ